MEGTYGDLASGVRRGKPLVAIEAKWKAGGASDTKTLLHFAKSYPDAELIIVAHDIDRPFIRKEGEQTLHYKNLSQLIKEL